MRSRGGRAMAARWRAANPRAWLVSAGRFKAIDGIRRRARFDALEDFAEQVEATPTSGATWRRRGHRGRSAAPDLHLLPPGAAARGPGRADAARGLRAHDRGDRAGVPERRADARPAHRARQGKNPRCAHSLPGAVAGRSAGAAGQRAAGDLSGVQRRLLRVVRGVAHAARPVGRSDSLGGCDRTAARARGDRAARADAVPGIAAGGARLPTGELSCWKTRTVRSGTGSKSRRDGAARARARVAAFWSVHDPGGDRGGARRCGERPMRPIGTRSSRSTTSCAHRSVARRRVEPGGGRGDARWPGGGSGAIDDILARGDLADYHLAHAARADLCRRLGRTVDARASYERAIELAHQVPERRFLERRLAELPD